MSKRNAGISDLSEHDLAMGADYAAHPGTTWAEVYRRVRDAKRKAPHWRWPTASEAQDARDGETD